MNNKRVELLLKKLNDKFFSDINLKNKIINYLDTINLKMNCMITIDKEQHYIKEIKDKFLITKDDKYIDYCDLTFYELYDLLYLIKLKIGGINE